MSMNINKMHFSVVAPVPSSSRTRNMEKGVTNEKTQCKTCRYRMNIDNVYRCDYLGKTGERRGCPGGSTGMCTKYEKGGRRKIAKNKTYSCKRAGLCQ